MPAKHKQAAANEHIHRVLGVNPSPQVFGHWAKKRGIMLHPDVAFLVPVKGMGRGAFARRTLPAGTVVVSCPFSSCISPYSNNTNDNKLQKGHEVQTILQSQCSVKNDNVLKVVLRLMAQLCKCKPHSCSSTTTSAATTSHRVGLTPMSLSLSSTWQPWLQACPRMPHHLFDLTVQQAQVLLSGKKYQYMWKLQQRKQNVNGKVSLQSEANGGSDNSTQPQLNNNTQAVDTQQLIQPKQHEQRSLQKQQIIKLQQLQEMKAQQSLQQSKAPQTMMLTVSTRWTHLSQQLQQLRVHERWMCAQPVIQRHPAHWPQPLANFTLFCECLAQVLSRNFHRDEVAQRQGPYLLPGLDILNHSSCKPNVSLEIHGGGRQHEMAFTAITTRPILRHEQILLSYGRIGSARFVTQFQFLSKEVLEEDMVRFSVDCMVQMALSYHNHHDHQKVQQQQQQQKQECNILTENMQRELRRRIEYMQRAGVLYEEGFYLHNPLLASASDTHSTADAICSVLPVSQQSSNVQADVRVLQIVVYLLLFCDKAAFNDTYKVMNKSWQSPLQCFRSFSSSSLLLRTASTCERTYKSQMLYFLRAKWTAAHVQDTLVNSLFCVDTNQVSLSEAQCNAVRRKLVHATLQS